MTPITVDDYHPHVERHLRRIERELIEELKEQKNAEGARRVIREKALQVERIGSGYACNFFGIENFYAAEDFAEITRIVEDVRRTFMYGGNLQSAAITLTSVMLARATVNKAKQISYKLGAIMRMKSLQDMLTPPDEGDPDFQTIEQMTPDAPATGLWFVWRTMNDALVCPICDALDGMQWDFEDPNVDSEILTPVVDTHPNCRCRIDLERREGG